MEKHNTFKVTVESQDPDTGYTTESQLEVCSGLTHNQVVAMILVGPKVVPEAAALAEAIAKLVHEGATLVGDPKSTDAPSDAQIQGVNQLVRQLGGHLSQFVQRTGALLKELVDLEAAMTKGASSAAFAVHTSEDSDAPDGEPLRTRSVTPVVLPDFGGPRRTKNTLH